MLVKWKKNNAEYKFKQMNLFYYIFKSFLMKDLNSTKIGKLYRLVIYTRWRYHKTSLHTHRIPGNGFRT